MFEFEVDFTDSFYKKTNPQNYIDALQDTLGYMGDLFVQGLKDEAPVRTGRLRDGHYSMIMSNQVLIGNNVPYAKYVIYGTSRQAPNNYPARVANRAGFFVSQSGSVFESSLIMKGVL